MATRGQHVLVIRIPCLAMRLRHGASPAAIAVYSVATIGIGYLGFRCVWISIWGAFRLHK